MTNSQAARAGAALGQADRAYQRLQAMIVTSALPPGSMHLEAELAQMLEMSRTPVHEAAIRLAGDGLVEIKPRRGVRIRPLSARDMEEIYEILTELEPLAAAKLASQKPTPEGLAPLEADLAAMEDALARDDRDAWARADDHFHATLVNLAGNQRLELVVNQFAAQVHRARMTTLWLRPLPRDSNADHRRLVDAIANGDPDAAQREHRRHREKAKALLLKLLDQHNLHAV